MQLQKETTSQALRKFREAVVLSVDEHHSGSVLAAHFSKQLKPMIGNDMGTAMEWRGALSGGILSGDIDRVFGFPKNSVKKLYEVIKNVGSDLPESSLELLTEIFSKSGPLAVPGKGIVLSNRASRTMDKLGFSRAIFYPWMLDNPLPKDPAAYKNYVETFPETELARLREAFNLYVNWQFEKQSALIKDANGLLIGRPVNCFAVHELFSHYTIPISAQEYGSIISRYPKAFNIYPTFAIFQPPEMQKQVEAIHRTLAEAGKPKSL